MDQHPIPQNVTGFQFKLIGSMTVKQFGYLAVGIILAVIMFYVPLKGVASLLKVILIPFFGSTGAVFAFLPIDGRPLDVMAGNFFRAIFSPNQYVYRKGLKRFSFSTVKLRSLQSKSSLPPRSAILQKQQAASDRSHELRKILTNDAVGKVNNAQDVKEAAFLETFLSAPIQPQTSVSPFIQSQSVAPTHLSKPVMQNPAPSTPKQSEQASAAANNEALLSQKEDNLKKQLESAKKAETAGTAIEQNASHQKTMDLEKQLQEIHAQKELLEQEIVTLKKQLAMQKMSTPVIQAAPKVAPPKPKTPAGHVRSIPQDQNKRMGIIVSDTPNVVMGTVKDARGNVLPNILVEIKDKSENPVRAFKTNALGNFASATPLSPGTYTITLEDVKKEHTFDSIQITANNQIMLPIEIISYDKREQLRKDLFS
jgi:hypothetical protein